MHLIHLFPQLKFWLLSTPALKNYPDLAAGVVDGAEVTILSENQDGIQQITALLQRQSPTLRIDLHGADTLVGNFSAIDPDTNSTLRYSLVNGGGDVDNSAFQIVGNQRCQQYVHL